MKNVCFVVYKLSDGGAERVTSVLANKFDEKHYNVTIIKFQCDDMEYKTNDTVNLCTIEYNQNIILFILKFIRIIRYSKFDTIIGMDILPNLMVCFSKFFNSSKIIISERNDPKNVEINPLLKILRKIFYRLADCIVFQTHNAKSYYSKRIQSKGIIIENPIIDILSLKQYNKINREIVTIGRLTKQKNIYLLINAMEIIAKVHPDYSLSIYGRGELESDLKSYVKQKGLEKKINFKGFKKNVHELIKNADIFVLASIYEGMPNALIEAMSMGFPVISSNCPCGGPRELIQHKINGLLFNNNDLDDLIKQINFLIENPDFKIAMGKKAYNDINKRLNCNKIVEKWVSIL